MWHFPVIPAVEQTWDECKNCPSYRLMFPLNLHTEKIIFPFHQCFIRFSWESWQKNIILQRTNRLLSVCCFPNAGIAIVISVSVSCFQGSKLLFLELISHLSSFLPQLTRCKWVCDLKMICLFRKDLSLAKLPVLFGIILDEVDNIHCSCKDIYSV